MTKTREQKEKEVAYLTDRLTRQKATVLSEFSGLTMGDLELLRKEMRAAGGEYRVAKKSLIARAFRAAQVEGASLHEVKQSCGLAFGFEDELAPAKVLKKFSKGRETFRIIAGLLERKQLSGDEVRALASIPGRVEMLARLVGVVSNPVQGLVGICAGTMRNLVSVLGQIKK